MAGAPALQISQWIPDCHSRVGPLILLFLWKDYSLWSLSPCGCAREKGQIKGISVYPPDLSNWDVRNHWLSWGPWMRRGIEVPKEEVMKGSEQAKIPERTMWFVCFCSLKLGWKVQRAGTAERRTERGKEELTLTPGSSYNIYKEDLNLLCNICRKKGQYKLKLTWPHPVEGPWIVIMFIFFKFIICIHSTYS